ncbi:MAG: hypothetical protein GXY41_07065 [Phycisphaerae bacterium]|nr:hypothetical protein [Phycisphaerae bacterium]
MTPDQSLERIQAPEVVTQPVSIGPRPAERENDDTRKQRRRRPERHKIEETLDEEQPLRVGDPDEHWSHIDYHA